MAVDLTSVETIARRFRVDGELVEVAPWGAGHIHATFLSTWETASGVRRFVHQRINDEVFPDVAAVMENIERVTAHLASKIRDEGGDPAREALDLVPTSEGASYLVTESGESWRTYRFIEGARTFEVAETTELAYRASEAFGRFARLLEDLPGPRLHEVIPRFHHTPSRVAAFFDAVRRDAAGRASLVRSEVAFVESWVERAARLVELHDAGSIPERVTHNDTKLNNVMFDARTGSALCVVDLDTVMPGLALYDFGDSVRLGACRADEDERDLARVELDLELFAALARGYLDALGEVLLPTEIEELALSAELMCFECGLRFLTDHLEGDRYFKIHRAGHNLDRCRRHFALNADMERKSKQMATIVQRAVQGASGK